MSKGIRIALLGLIAVSASAFSQVVPMAHGGSTLEIFAGLTGAGAFGARDWRIGNSASQLVQQLYLVGIGNNPVNSMNILDPNPIINQPSPDLANITYNVGGLEFAFRYLLTGAAPFSADLAEVLTISNRGPNPVNLRLFEYDDFNLNGTPGGDTGVLLNSSTVRQSDGLWRVTVGATPIPDRWQIDNIPALQASVLGGNLTNAASPFTGPNVGFAYQWNLQMGAGERWQMSKNKILQVVPEPATMLALGTGVAVLLRRRKKTS